MIPPATLDELKRLLEQATPGPWRAVKDEFEGGHDAMIASMSEVLRRGHHVLYFLASEEKVFTAVTGNGPTSKANAKLISAVIDALPSLIAAAERANVLEEFAIDVRDGWDCDEDAHRYGMRCRCCEAAKLVGAKP